MRNRLVVALGVAAIALALVAFVGPWWVVNSSGNLMAHSFTGTNEYRPFGSTVTTQGPYPNATTTTVSDYHDLPVAGRVFLLGSALTALGVLSGAGMVAAGFIQSPAPRLRKRGPILAILASAFVLASALYVMASLPAAVNEPGGSPSYPFSGFWGSTSASGFSWSLAYSYGAGWAWYALLAAALLFLIGGVVLFRLRTAAASSGATPKVPHRA